VKAVADAMDKYGLDKIPRAFNGEKELVMPLAEDLSSRIGGVEVVLEHTDISAAVTAAALSPQSQQPMDIPLDHKVRRASYPQDIVQKERLEEMYSAMFFEIRGRRVPAASLTALVQAAMDRADVWGYFVNNEPVSTAFLGRPTRNGKSVQNVYTNSLHRNKGYASILVGEVCRRVLLEEGEVKHLQIFFKEGGAAEKIYRRIGFGGAESFVSVTATLKET